jgi:hypothetical protein
MRHAREPVGSKPTSYLPRGDFGKEELRQARKLAEVGTKLGTEKKGRISGRP